MEIELEKLLQERPPIDPEEIQTEYAAQLAAIDQKIDRLMAALSESDDLSMPYINRTIRKLEKEREELTTRQAQSHARPAPTALNFAALPFDQKKLVAAQFIQAVRLTGNRAEVVWKV